MHPSSHARDVRAAASGAPTGPATSPVHPRSVRLPAKLEADVAHEKLDRAL